MAEQTPESLSHFAIITFSETYWKLDVTERTRLRTEWLSRVRGASEGVHLYQLSGLEAAGDLLVWSAISSALPDATAAFFSAWAAACQGYRHLFTTRDVLWGFTRPSQYTKTRSTQEMDPFGPTRQPFLMIYPFVKTTEWYQLDRETRGKMMMSHIKVGKQFEDITQLLLYSFGLQDQEFVVVYETADPRRFLALVNDLRSTEARIYTQRDWPLHAAVYQADDAALAKWL
jgi:chlorite dismutase